tara:strand:+ start:52 stop:657 length:606 start_codon:yes stop_codon:yes gene_type:complete
MKYSIVILIQLFFITTLIAKVETNYNGEYVEISWDNPFYINIDYFIIEKSNNGKNYKEINTVPASNTNKTKKFFYEVDYSKISRQTFYRIKHVDINGYSYYSNISIVQPQKKFNLFSRKKPTKENYQAKNILVVLENSQNKTYTVKIDISTGANGLKTISNNENLPIGNYIIISTSDNKIFGKEINVYNDSSNFAYTQNTE